MFEEELLSLKNILENSKKDLKAREDDIRRCLCQQKG
jgi:hypothetical protein